MQPTHIIIFLLTVFIYTINTGAYAARLAGVRTGHPTLAGSLFNVLDLGARGANALVTPLVSSITDMAANTQNTADLLNTYRLLLLAASVGTIIAAFLIPTLSRLLARGVDSYEKRRSLPEVVVNAASVQGLWRARHSLTTPRIGVLRELRRSPFPKRFLLASVLVTAISAVTNPATLYASALVPAGARTATSLAPMLSGFGMLLIIFVINPLAAITVDEALRGQRPLKDVTYITIWQVGAQLVGTVVAQALLFPASWVIVQITQWLISL